MSLPALSTEDREFLNADISLQELTQAISNSSSSKAPGPDGFSSEFYKLLKEEVSPTLLSLFNDILHTKRYPPTFQEAYVRLLPKKDKDALKPESYRPISLLNVDAKLLSKILADRLACILPQLISDNQVGFVKGRSAVTNIRKVLTVMEEVRLSGHSTRSAALLTLDAEKAFDNVCWQWLLQVMAHMGITGTFSDYVTTVYTSPTARLFLSTGLSPSICLHRGTRQGCPLSPLLFNLAVEPLSRYLDTHPMFVTGPSPLQKVRISLFADDIILVLTDPRSQLGEIFAVLDRFRSFSGLVINREKSELLPLTKFSPRVLTTWSTAHKIKIARDNIRYLGIRIPRKATDIYSLNYSPLFKKITQELHNWRNLPLSLLGRCHLIRMVSVARLLYPMQVIPLLLKHKDVQLLHRAFTSFIWRGKKSRISLLKFKLPMSHFGIKFPDVRKYNLASIFRHIRDWLFGTSYYTNLELEQSAVAPWSLSGILHTPLGQLPPYIKKNVLLRDTIIAWRELRKLYRIPGTVSPLMPIRSSPVFPVGQQLCHFLTWERRGIRVLGDILNSEGGCMSLSELRAKYRLPASHFLPYAQIRSLIRSYLRDGSRDASSRFHQSLLSSPNTRFSLSLLYSRMGAALNSTKITDIPCVKKWADFLQLTPEVTSDLLMQGWLWTKAAISSELWREILFKLIHRAIGTFQISPTQSSPTLITCCPKCQAPKPDLHHLLWLCPASQVFWTSILGYMNSVSSRHRTLSPALLLFHALPPPHGDSSPRPTRWEILCSLAAKKLLLVHWLQPTTPSLSDLKLMLHKLMLFDKLDTNFVESKTDRFFSTWSPYLVLELTKDQLKEVLQMFQYSKWYLTRKLSGTLGDLDVL